MCPSCSLCSFSVHKIAGSYCCHFCVRLHGLISHTYLLIFRVCRTWTVTRTKWRFFKGLWTRSEPVWVRRTSRCFRIVWRSTCSTSSWGLVSVAPCTHSWFSMYEVCLWYLPSCTFHPRLREHIYIYIYMYMWDSRQERVVVRIKVGNLHLHAALRGIIELLKVWISHSISFIMSLLGFIGVHFGRQPLKMKAAGFPECWYLSFGMWWPCGTAGRCQYSVETYCLRFQGVLPYFPTKTWPRTTEDDTLRPRF